MRRRSSVHASRRSSTLRRRSENVRFDEFGFARVKRKDQKLHHRCHDYSYPQLCSVRVKELCELLSYWNGASFICKSQIERFIRMGIPPNLRGRVWKCLLGTDSLRESSDFNYQKCLSEVRGPLVDLGVSEYGILSAIATLSDTQNDLDLNHQQLSSGPETCYSIDDIRLFRQIALDLQRSFPTHRSLMGDSPEAIEGQAKLFRVLTAYAKYNPQVGYSQGMSYIAAVLLMQLGEEEAFWALAALLDKPKYLAKLFDLSLNKVQHQVKVFDQFLKHRKPQLYQHMESVGVLSVHFVMPWFLTLFTSLPCWDSVLAVWDLIILHGLSAVFRTALTIIELLEPLLMNLNDEGAVLPLLLRVPVNVAQYTVLIPALWDTEAQDWELKCMNSLVLDDSHHRPNTEHCDKQKATLSNHIMERNEKENTSPSSEGGTSTEKDSVTGAKSVLTRVMHLAQRYLLDPMGRHRVEERNSQTQAKSRQRSPAPGRVFRSRTSTSLTQSQIRSRRQGQQRGGTHQPVMQGSSGTVNVASDSVTDTAGCGETDRPEFNLKRAGTGPVVKAARRHSNHAISQPIRVKSLRFLRSKKNPPSSSVLPSSLRSTTHPPSSFVPSSSPASPRASQSSEAQEQHDTPRAALIKELSSRHQTGVPFRNARESAMI
ncbi:TBC1 domain family member 12 isoform X2 [Anabas testudineus]|uniref:Rab-GAP TBC domain-containing protein n=1 Tax=Anabas testudineus TaxID=64144 RepID=A0A3Q1HYC6_ANATE|nr:TBC1 domain family member 12 isoform X2 [Anabas testudineus]